LTNIEGLQLKQDGQEEALNPGNFQCEECYANHVHMRARTPALVDAQQSNRVEVSLRLTRDAKVATAMVLHTSYLGVCRYQRGHALNPGDKERPVEMASQDSPLSIAANITGILTFVAAVVAGFYARAMTLKNAAIDTQSEVSFALEKIDFLETETDMLNNAFLASQIRHPDRKYGNGDFKYFQGLYANALHRMRTMDNSMRHTVTLVTGGNQYETLSRVKMAANWLASRDRLHKQIEERKAESARIFQIQLAMLSA
jgi:hypothetical protein